MPINEKLKKAIQEDDLDTAKYEIEDGRILRSGVSIDNDEVENKDRLLHLAAYHNSVKCLRYLLHKGANWRIKNNDGSIALHRAAVNNSIEAINILLDNGSNIEEKDAEGDTPLHYAIYFDKLEAMQRLLERGANIHAKGKNGFSTLHWAIYGNKIRIVRPLIDNRADLFQADINGDIPIELAIKLGNQNCINELLKDVNTNNMPKTQSGLTLLHYAVRKNDKELVQLLVNRRVNLEEADLTLGKTALHMASEGNCIDAMKILLANHANIEARGACEYTPLHAAAINNKKEAVELLISNKADIEAKSVILRTPLHTALLSNKENAINVLLSHEANANAVDLYGMSALHCAVSGNCNSSILSTLIDKGVNINAVDNNGLTPIHLAAKIGNVAALRLLKQRGADLTIQDLNGKTPKDLAISDNIHQFLISGADTFQETKGIVQSELNTNLFIAISQQELAQVQDYLHLGANVNDINANGFSPIFTAIVTNNCQILDILIRNNANINQIRTASSFFSPLAYAIFLKKNEAVRLLINKGASVEKVDDYGISPLLAAIITNNMEALRLLLPKANLNALSKGMSPLHYAIKTGNIEAFSLLVSQGADIYTEDKNGATLLEVAMRINDAIAELLLQKLDSIKKGNSTLLHLAVLNGDNSLLEQILTKKNNLVNVKDAEGTPLLSYAILKNNLYAVNLLLKTGADLSAVDNEQLTALHYAIRADNIETLQLLLNSGMNINMENKDGNLPLYYAAKQNVSRIVDFLIQQGADELKNKKGLTTLHIAVLENDVQTASLLISEGADVSITDNEGNSPLYYAIKKQDPAMLSLFNSHTKEKEINPQIVSTIFDAVINNNKELFDLLLSNKANINLEDKDGKTLLYYAAKHNRQEMIRALVQKGADKKLNKSGRTPLIAAICNNDTEVAARLIAEGANIVAEDKQRKPPLYYTAKLGNSVIAKILIAKKADEMLTSRYLTPLQVAVREDDQATAHFLVSNGANVCIEEKDGSTILETAMYINDQIFKILLQNGNSVRKGDSTLLHLAVAKKDTSLLKRILTYNQSLVNVRDSSGVPLLIYAILKNNLDSVALLLSEFNVDVNAVANKQWTALHYAASCANLDAIDLLIRCFGYSINGINTARDVVYINAKDAQGNTPLHIALSRQAYEIAYKLMLNGADITLANISRIPKLNILGFLKYLSSSQQRISTLHKLISDMLSLLDVSDPDGNTFLHLLVMDSNLPVLENLIHTSLSINTINNLGETLLHKAAFKGNLDILCFLIDNNVDISIKNSAGDTPLFYLKREKLESFKRLESAGYFSKLLLQYSKTGNLNGIQELISLGIDVNYEDNQKNTALTNSILNGHARIVNLLIQSGAHMHESDRMTIESLFLEGSKEMHRVSIEEISQNESKDQLQLERQENLPDECKDGSSKDESSKDEDDDSQEQVESPQCTIQNQSVFGRVLENLQSLLWETSSDVESDSQEEQKENSNIKTEEVFEETSESDLENKSGERPEDYSENLALVPKNQRNELNAQSMALVLKNQDSSISQAVIEAIFSFANKKDWAAVYELTQNSIDVRYGDGTTLLHVAAKTQDLEAIPDLIGRDANLLVQQDREDKTSFHYAIDTRKKEVIAKFLDDNLSSKKVEDMLETKDLNGMRALDYAVKYGMLDTVEMIMKRQVKVRKDNDNPIGEDYCPIMLRYAIANPDLDEDTIEKLINLSANSLMVHDNPRDIDEEEDVITYKNDKKEINKKIAEAKARGESIEQYILQLERY